MENASKALIIAGAILLAIVIISLGLVVVNNSRNTVDSANMNEQEIQTFNAKFTPYEGTKTGTQVKALLQAVIASNQANTSNKVSIVLATGTSLSEGTGNADSDAFISGVSQSVKSSSNYSVKLGYSNGRVNQITLK